MSERWIKEAEDLRPAGSPGVMTRNHRGVKVTWHVTVSPSGGTWFDAMHRVLTSKKSEPHILWDPLTDRLGQYFPLDAGARALANDGARPTNRDGAINIQIEVVGNPDGFTRYWRPGPNYRALMRAIRSWGIPDAWPAGPLAPSGRADQQVSRSWSHYVKSGHFGHCNVPGNNHWDPGPIDQRAIFTAAVTGGGAQSGPGVTLPALDEQEWQPTGRLTTKQIQELVDVTVDGVYGPTTTAAVRDLQEALDLTADGLWGPATEGAVMSLQSDIKALSAKVDGTTEWARKAVNAALWGGPARTTERLSAVLASTTGVDEQALAVAIADAIRDDVTAALKEASPGATADQIADEIARRLAKTE